MIRIRKRNHPRARAGGPEDTEFRAYFAEGFVGQVDGGDAASGERHEFDDGFLVTSTLPAIRLIGAKPSSNSCRVCLLRGRMKDET